MNILISKNIKKIFLFIFIQSIVFDNQLEAFNQAFNNNESFLKINYSQFCAAALGLGSLVTIVCLYNKTNESYEQKYLNKEEKLLINNISEDIALNGEDKKLKIELVSTLWKNDIEIRLNLTYIFNLDNILKKFDFISHKIFKIIKGSLLKEGYYKNLQINPYNFEAHIEKRADDSYICVLNFKIESERKIRNSMKNYDNNGNQIGESVYYTYKENPTLNYFFSKEYEYLNDDKKVFKEYYYYNSFSEKLMNYLWWNSLKNIFGFGLK